MTNNHSFDRVSEGIGSEAKAEDVEGADKDVSPNTDSVALEAITF